MTAKSWSALMLAILPLVSGCASASKTYGPDGREVFVLNCSGWARSWGMCYEKAGELCGPRGYQVIGRDEQNSMIGSAGGGSAMVAPVQHRNMMISCK